ncbi:LacI family DNA-binding transcriptional regulator [Microbacterium sp. STN6]|uniref:LacI family DNA-binding transcriptional regulator n=1 Tax=Microbacterium sp. STN6 TaxID=2995588 RepID=UPI002260E969|nr:LacI family DNA-binding transcriptional regulator [Microbacterium sp. STN6]MCX7522846.1 LacI family DNA-binding transcriptional regulator [Microbacterium sp. STN6]
MNEGAPRAERQRRATLKDVARLAGVSQSTTSRALSGEGYVAAGVRARVLAASEELRYVPHAMARSLRTQDSRSIGVLVSDLRNTFYADLAAGIAGRARANRYTMMLVDDQGSTEAELSAARAFVATRVAGVIVTPLSASVTDYLIGQRIPVVEVDRQFSAGRCDAVLVDNIDVARRMTDHLISLGHQRIALFIDETNWTTGSDRVEGFRRALKDAGIEPNPSLVISAGWEAAEARRAAIDVLARREHPTAIFAANNLLAEGVWRAASDLGLRIPDDVSIVSFDDSQWMSMVSPGITAVAQDAIALGEAAIDRLLARVAEPDAPPQTLVLEAQVLPRGSTAAPRAGA